MRLRSLACSVVALSAAAAAFVGCASLSGINDLEVTDRDCVKNCADTGAPVAETTPDTGTPETPPEIGTLTIEPGDQVVFLDTGTTPTTAATLTYKATLTAKDGSTKDVSATATFSLDDATLGTFTGATFKSAATLPSVAVTTTVRATAEGAEATARLSIVAMRKDRDLYVTAAKDSEQKQTVLSHSRVDRIDLVLLMDTTGSMSGAIANVQKNLKDTLFPNVSKVSPDAALAIVDHKDYPVSPYGDTTDFPVKVLQTMTKDVMAASTAADLWKASGGFDGPESQLPAMQHILTGEALAWTGGMLPAHMPAEGTTGAVEFRANALKVIALITDVNWHGEGHTPYTGFTAPTMAQVKATFNAQGAKFVDLTTPFGGEQQADELSDATLSAVPVAAFGDGCAGQCCTGIDSAGRPPIAGGMCRLNFLHNSGAGVSEAIVNAIRAMPKGLTFQGGIGAFVANEPMNPDAVDVTTMVKVRAMNEGTADCIARGARDTNMDSVNDTFNGPVRVDNKLCFEVTVNNTTVDSKPAPQFFVGYLDFLAQPGAARLERRLIVVYVPPT